MVPRGGQCLLSALPEQKGLKLEKILRLLASLFFLFGGPQTPPDGHGCGGACPSCCPPPPPKCSKVKEEEKEGEKEN